ncbi:MAG TPA: DUF1648 domain-containing protein [Candidatus Cybelea sp.]|jgi:hypothetical protein|nr:DUF1648 domain-containing protein [Candidatus Cybelea sp.]
MGAFLMTIGVGIVVLTIAATISRYADLPPRIPLHFNFDGTVNGSGPRPMVWSLPVVQVIVALTLGNGIELGRRPLGVLALGDCILAICLGAQLLILNTAASRQPRAPIAGYWMFFILMMGLGVAALRIIQK